MPVEAEIARFALSGLTVPVTRRYPGVRTSVHFGRGNDMWAALPPAATIGARFSPVNFHQGRLDVLLKAMGLKANVGNRWNLMSLLLDPAFNLAGAIGVGREYILSNVRQPLEFAACFPTGEHLFPILTGVTAPNAAFHGQSNGLMALPDSATFLAEVNGLITQIQAYEHAGTAAVCRIEFAGHGFTLILRRPAPHQAMRIELIESLAHTSAIHEGLRWPQIFAVAGVCTSLQEMASDGYPTRKRGALFFGWRAKGIFLHDAGDPDEDGYPLSSYSGEVNAIHGEYFPCTKMKWWCHPLAANGLQDWWTMAEDRLTALEIAFPGAAQGGPPPKRRKL